LAEFKIK